MGKGDTLHSLGDGIDCSYILDHCSHCHGDTRWGYHLVGHLVDNGLLVSCWVKALQLMDLNLCACLADGLAESLNFLLVVMFYRKHTPFDAKLLFYGQDGLHQLGRFVTH